MRKGSIFLLFCFFLFGQVFAEPQTLRISEIDRVMERMFTFHIESKEWNATLIRRAMKLYIEQFDSEKMLLLSREAAPYLQLSDRKAEEIRARLEAGNYSDFIALNALFQRAIYRSEGIRALVSQRLMDEEISDRSVSASPFFQYAASEEDLMERQKGRIARFYLFQASKTPIKTQERKAKVFALYERKMRRAEAPILMRDAEGNPFAAEKAEDLLATRILKACAKSLDTHTSFFSAEEARELRTSLEKQFQGIGVVLSEGIDGIMIADLLQGSPAELCGKIKVNDLLVEIDGKKVDELPFEDALGLLKKKGRDVTLGFKRLDTNSPNSTYYEVTLRKQAIVMNEERIETSIEKLPNGGIIGKITLHSFYEGGDGISSEKDLREAIRSFQQQGNVQGIVLDLRENSGGFLSQAVKVTGLFVSHGVVVISKYSKGEIHYLRNLSARPFFNGPLVILTSKMSASAAEIVAQALQDYGVGIVVGDERTFGKGSIQYQTVTDERADLFFKITVGRYYTPSGRSTQISGVVADIVVPTQYAPFNIGERFLEYPLSPDSVTPAYVDPLTDLDENAKTIFRQRYLPYLQKVVPQWKEMLPQLKKNSAARLSKNIEFQAFLRRLETIKLRQGGQPANSVDEPIQLGMQDLQMRESVNILKDMIMIQAQKESPDAAAAFLPTGTDD